MDYKNFAVTWNFLKTEVSRLFSEEVWETFFEKNNTAKILAAAPFVADLVDADRIAYSNLVLLYAGSSSPIIGGHRTTDEAGLEIRLHMLPLFRDDFRLNGKGNHAYAVLNVARALIKTRLIKDYEFDLTDDHRKGKVNPVATGVFNVQREIKEASDVIEGNPEAVADLTVAVSSIDGSLTSTGGATTLGIW